MAKVWMVVYLCLNLMILERNITYGSDQREDQAVIAQIESYIFENGCVFPSMGLMRPTEETIPLQKVCQGPFKDAKTVPKVMACLELYNLTAQICNDKINLTISVSCVEKMMNTSILCTQVLQNDKGLEDPVQELAMLQKLHINDEAKCRKFCDPNEVGSLCALLIISDMELQLYRHGLQEKGLPTLSPRHKRVSFCPAETIELSPESKSGKEVPQNKPALKSGSASSNRTEQSVQKKPTEESASLTVRPTSQFINNTKSTEKINLSDSSSSTKPAVNNKGSEKSSTKGVDESQPEDGQIKEPESHNKDETKQKTTTEIKLIKPKEDDENHDKDDYEGLQMPSVDDTRDDLENTHKNIGIDQVDENINNNNHAKEIFQSYYSSEDGHFFIYFLAGVALCVVLYLVFHNKQKIIALIIEGRQDRRYRGRGGRYRRLSASDAEEAPSKWKSTESPIIY